MSDRPSLRYFYNGHGHEFEQNQQTSYECVQVMFENEVATTINEGLGPVDGTSLANGLEQMRIQHNEWQNFGDHDENKVVICEKPRSATNSYRNRSFIPGQRRWLVSFAKQHVLFSKSQEKRWKTFDSERNKWTEYGVCRNDM